MPNRVGEWFYRLLLRLHPRAFGRENEAEMLDHARRTLAQRRGFVARLAWWCRLYVDLVANAVHLRLESSRWLPASTRGKLSRGRGRSGAVGRWCSELGADTRSALRVLTKHPTGTVVAVLSIALGIGANTAFFTLLDVVLLRDLPVQRPEELVTVTGHRTEGRLNISYPVFQELRLHQDVFAGVLAAAGSGLVRTREGGKRLSDVRAESVSGDYFEVLGVRPVVGRLLDADDDRPGGGSGGPVAVLSHTFWERQYSLDSDVLGSTLDIEGVSYTVVGVTPRSFFGASVGSHPDLWLPMSASMSASTLEWRTGSFFSVMARLAEGMTIEQAQPRVSELFRRILAEEVAQGLETLVRDDDRLPDLGLALEPAANGFGTLRRAYSTPLAVLMAIAALVLLIACCNVANLQLTEVATRRHELSTRLALGAGRLRIARQLLVQSLMLAGFGGLLGLALAQLGVRALGSFLVRSGAARALDLEPDLRVLGFTAAATLATGLLFGLAPALRASRTEPGVTLRPGAASLGDGPAGRRVGAALVVGQLSLSLVLVVAAGLLLRSLVLLHRVDLGFEPERVLLMRVAFELEEGEEARERFLDRLDEVLTSLPGVAASASAWLGLFSTSDMSANLEIEGFEPAGDPPSVRVNSVSPGYFEALGATRLAGRDFTTGDDQDSPGVAIVNASFAERYFGGDALGRTLQLRGDERRLEVVGVYEDFRWNDLREPLGPMFFLAARQWPMAVRSLALRVDGDPMAVAPAARKRLEDLGANALVRQVVTLGGAVDSSIARERILAQLATAFGLLGLFLAAVGLYGVLAAGVAQRIPEIAVRLALGATARQVTWMIQRRTSILLAVGIAIGVPAVLATSRYFETFLYGLGARDLATLMAGVLVLAVIAFAAGYFPARRAARLETISALRYE